MSNVHVGIVTTASRASVLARMVQSLRNEYLDMEIFCDIQPGLWGNTVAAWDNLFAKSDRCLLLQDDLIASKNWYLTTLLFASKFQSPIVTFFHPNRFVSDVRNMKRGWVAVDGETGIWGQANLFTRQFWEGFKAWATPKNMEPHRQKNGGYHDDNAYSDYASRIGASIVVSCPPIFQHVGRKSTLGHAWNMFGRGGRQSPEFRGEEWDSYGHFQSALFHK